MNTHDNRIPVYLLTGYLGSGKTSLLKAWLGQDAFKDAALVINELGEVGLDNQLLRGATESAALVATSAALSVAPRSSWLSKPTSPNSLITRAASLNASCPSHALSRLVLPLPK